MHSDGTLKPHRYGWVLIPITLGAFLWGGEWAAILSLILSLILSRWLRPFSRAAWVGYALCWLMLTLIPVAVVATSGYWEWSWQRAWPPGIYMLVAVTWWLLRPRFFRLPSITWQRAVLVSLLGALLTAPGYGGYLNTVLPVALVLGLAAYQLLSTGELSLVVETALYTAPITISILFLAHLAVYWPLRRKNAPQQQG